MMHGLTECTPRGSSRAGLVVRSVAATKPAAWGCDDHCGDPTKQIAPFVLPHCSSICPAVRIAKGRRMGRRNAYGAHRIAGSSVATGLSIRGPLMSCPTGCARH